METTSVILLTCWMHILHTPELSMHYMSQSVIFTTSSASWEPQFFVNSNDKLQPLLAIILCNQRQLNGTLLDANYVEECWKSNISCELSWNIKKFKYIILPFFLLLSVAALKFKLLFVGTCRVCRSYTFGWWYFI